VRYDQTFESDTWLLTSPSVIASLVYSWYGHMGTIIL